MSYLEELLPEFRKGAKIRRKSWLNEKAYLHIYNGKSLSSIFYDEELLADDWEFYTEPYPDWDYIIKNKCLCYFWDDEDNEDEKFNNIGFIEHYDTGRFLSSESFGYDHCRPVRRDEVTFYEDRKDEL